MMIPSRCLSSFVLADCIHAWSYPVEQGPRDVASCLWPATFLAISPGVVMRYLVEHVPRSDVAGPPARSTWGAHRTRGNLPASASFLACHPNCPRLAKVSCYGIRLRFRHCYVHACRMQRRCAHGVVSAGYARR